MKLFAKKSPGNKKAIFLDRDGVINKDKPGKYILCENDIKFYPSALKALKKISQEKKYILVIVTNQSAVGRQMMTMKKSKQINRYVVKQLEKVGIEISALYFCPHSPQEKCKCRKPHTAMINQALKDFNIDLSQSWLVGDKKSDMDMAKKSGIKSVFVMTGQAPRELREKKIRYDFLIRDLRGLVAII